jgi:hypothetical protein
LHSTFAASGLVRLLGAWTPVEREAGGMDVAERASLWFSAFDAIRLQAVHQSIRAAQARPQETRAVDAQALAAQVQRVRSTLARAIAQDLPEPGTPPEFIAFQRRHLELQRLMEMAIAPLRDHVRQAIAHASGRLRQLAALDEAMEQVLAAREQALLPTTAALMERRFAQLRTSAADDWLQTFEADWRQALLCELDLRLQPATGLLDALVQDTETDR